MKDDYSEIVIKIKQGSQDYRVLKTLNLIMNQKIKQMKLINLI